jgi:hypothetical protein
MAHLAHCSDNEYRLATSPKAAVGSHQHAVDVGLAQCGRHEPVVFGMHEDTAGGALGRPRRHELVVGLVGERQVRHGERAGDVDGQRLRRGLFAQPRDEPVAAGEHVGYAVVLLKQRDRGQRGHHRHRREPERTRDEEGSGRFAKHLGAENRRDRVTVADRLSRPGNQCADPYVDGHIWKLRSRFRGKSTG